MLTEQYYIFDPDTDWVKWCRQYEGYLKQWQGEEPSLNLTHTLSQNIRIYKKGTSPQMEWPTTLGNAVKSSVKTKNPFSVLLQFSHMSPQRGHNYLTNKRCHMQGFAFCLSDGCYIRKWNTWFIQVAVNLKSNSNAISTATPETIRPYSEVTWMGWFNKCDFFQGCHLFDQISSEKLHHNFTLDWSN